MPFRSADGINSTGNFFQEDKASSINDTVKKSNERHIVYDIKQTRGGVGEEF